MAGDFDRLYARIFYAGVYRHAVEVQKVADNPERGLLGQSQLLDCCYHAGAAVEQLIYGLLIENGELNRLWSKPFRGENCFILPLAAATFLTKSPHIRRLPPLRRCSSRLLMILAWMKP